MHDPSPLLILTENLLLLKRWNYFEFFTFLFANKTLQDTENTPTTSANLTSEKANFTPQETQGVTKSSKGCSPPSHVPPATASDTIKEGSKEKSGPTSLPLGKLFWKKVSLVVRPLQGPGDGLQRASRCWWFWCYCLASWLACRCVMTS